MKNGTVRSWVSKAHFHARVLRTHWKAERQRSVKGMGYRMFPPCISDLQKAYLLSLRGPAARTQSVVLHTDLIVVAVLSLRAGLTSAPHQMVERKQQGPWLLTHHPELSAWVQPPLRMKPTGWMTFSHNPDNTMLFRVSSKIIKCNLFILSLPNSCLLFLLFNQRFFLELAGLNLTILLPLPPELSDSKQASLRVDLNSCPLI